jgi:hypothetical protein
MPGNDGSDAKYCSLILPTPMIPNVSGLPTAVPFR